MSNTDAEQQPDHFVRSQSQDRYFTLSRNRSRNKEFEYLFPGFPLNARNDKLEEPKYFAMNRNRWEIYLGVGPGIGIWIIPDRSQIQSRSGPIIFSKIRIPSCE